MRKFQVVERIPGYWGNSRSLGKFQVIGKIPGHWENSNSLGKIQVIRMQVWRERWPGPGPSPGCHGPGPGRAPGRWLENVEKPFVLLGFLYGGNSTATRRQLDGTAPGTTIRPQWKTYTTRTLRSRSREKLNPPVHSWQLLTRFWQLFF